MHYIYRRSGHQLVIMINNSGIIGTTSLRSIETGSISDRAHVTHKRRFNSIKSNIFKHYWDSVAAAVQISLSVLIPDFFFFFFSFFYPFIRFSSARPRLNLCLYAEPVLFLPPLTPSSSPALVPRTALRALGRIQKFWGGGKQVCTGVRMRGPGLFLSESSTSFSLCLLLVQENQRRSAPSQPCLRGVWLQRKESEEVGGKGGFWSDRSNSEGNTENIRRM